MTGCCRTAPLERVAGGFEFTEGPVWTRDGARLFSSPNTNQIYRLSRAGQVTVHRSHSGYTGTDIGRYHQPGSNGLTFDPQGRLTLCQHGNRRVIRVESHGNITVLADRYHGNRLNSPNDLAYRSDGTLYCTDPPFGLPEVYDDPKKELGFSGVFMVRDGEVHVVDDALAGPNGLAFSPDERFLYVGNWDPANKVVMRYDVAADGAVSNRQLFFDMTDADGEDAIDGIKVDELGNLMSAVPEGWPPAVSSTRSTAATGSGVARRWPSSGWTCRTSSGARGPALTRPRPRRAAWQASQPQVELPRARRSKAKESSRG